MAIPTGLHREEVLGRGHLQQRSRNTWRLKVYVGRSPDGRKRYVERTVRGTKREAERKLARLVVEVDEGRHVAAAPMTLGELLDRWLAVKKQSVEASTLKSYEWVSRKYIRPALGDRKLASLRPIELDDFYGSLFSSGLSARTVRLCHTVIRQSLEQRSNVPRRWPGAYHSRLSSRSGSSPSSSKARSI